MYEQCLNWIGFTGALRIVLRVFETEVSEKSVQDRLRISLGFRNSPNMNTNIICVKKYGQVRKQLLFGFRNLAEYKLNNIKNAKFLTKILPINQKSHCLRVKPLNYGARQGRISQS